MPKKLNSKKEAYRCLCDNVSATMASPPSTIDSPITSAARATNVDIDSDSDEECEQTFIGSCVAEPLSLPKLKDAEDNTIITHRNYCSHQLYAYQVQYYDKPQP